ncbi:kelch-like protein 10 [Galendromus occidentalis]|uniref:Kelch-like protein diablo n=1 Tax=Galendromus occidentalis TaxID=34638 RepID=A0AAJ7PA48_9ACAR|nr:kelch-like protein 10 [Galendromus occidentalis]
MVIPGGGVECLETCVANSSPDTVLVCDDGSKIKAHRLPLAATSAYFRVAFFEFGKVRNNESIRKQVRVPMLKMEQVEAAVTFANKGEVELSLRNIQDVLEAADFLGMESLVQVCHKFMKEKSNGPNVLDLWRLCDKYLMNGMRDHLYHRIMEDFCKLTESDDLYETSFEEFHTFLNDDCLNVRDEDKLWSICERWIRHDFETRHSHIFELLQTIRVYLIDEAAVRDLLSSSSLLSGHDRCKFYLMRVHSSMNTRTPFLHDLGEELPVKSTIPREPHGVILILGGWLQAPSNLFEVYDPSADRHTTFPQLADTNELRAYHKMALVNNEIYVIGGFHGDNHYHKNCRKFSLSTRTWSHVTPMNVERCYVSVAVVDGKIYAIGGYNGRFRLNTAEVLNLETNQWSLIRPMEYQRSDAACAVVNGKIYAIGGFTGTMCNRTVECYDPASNSWTLVSSMSTVRSGVSAVALDGKIYALGGSSGSSRLSSCEVYDPATDKWSPIAPMLTARSNFATVVCASYIYVFGGYTGQATTKFCECYSPATNEWFVLTDMTHPRSALAAIFIPCFDGIRELSYPNRKQIFLEAQRPPVVTEVD